MCIKFIIVSILIGLSIASLAQEEPLTISYFCRDTSLCEGQFHRGPGQHLQGIVVLKIGDTLSGCMQFIHNLCAFPKASDREYRYIKSRDIKKIELQIYSLYRKPVELYSMNRKHMRGVFWRLIESKGKFTVYDRSEGLFSDLFIVE